MLEYKVIDEEPKDFTSAKKVEFHQEIILNDEVVEEAIIAQGLGGLSGGKTGLFLYKENELTDDDEKSWKLEFEAQGERQLLLKLADLSENREVKIK